MLFRCVTGVLLVLASIGYYWMLPKPPLVIVIDGARIMFKLGWCFWLVLVAGALCLFIGFIVTAIDLIWPHRFSTILEVYYDTPYDRHVILEESHDVRYRKRNSKGGLEEPPSLGSRILRRLSSKTREQTMNDMRGLGIENRAFQTDVPKSPWRYPFRRSASNPKFQRTVSQDSTSSIASAVAHASNSPAGQLPLNLHKATLSRMLPPRPPMDRNKDANEISNW